MSKRLEYQKMFARGKVINIGCGEVPVDLGEEVTHVDMDNWDHPNFVQADAHDLHMFRDKEFDTAVLGDVLEHSPDPVKMLKEASRVAKLVVATIFEEWRHEGKTAQERVEISAKQLKEMGFDNLYDYYKSLPLHSKVIDIVPDDVVPHHEHIQNFTDESLRKCIEDAGLEIHILKKYKEGEVDGREYYNWLVVAR